MTRRDAPPSARSLEARLRNLCRDRGVPEGRARRLVGVIVTGQLLSDTDAGAIKGATNLEVRLGTGDTRLSSDLDAVGRTDVAAFRDTLAKAVRVGWAGFAGEVTEPHEIPTPAPDGYRPHRMRLKLRYQGGAFVSFDLEVSPEEAGGLALIEAAQPVDSADWFAALGLPQPGSIPVLALPHQMAQKLHACTAPDAEGGTNDRVHDLVDLQLTMAAYDGGLADVKAAAQRLFAARQGHTWPPRVTARTGWKAAYPAQAQGLPVIQTLDEAIAWANDLIARIDAA